jgi:drug/metabolite transporter (DMT)-like permease
LPAGRQETEDGPRIGAALALAASLSWGFADFFGPLKGRTLGALRVLFGAQVAGLAGIGLVVAIRGKGPADAVVLLAIPAALSGTLGLYAYYRGVAVGAMSVVAPIAGVSAGVPVAVGLATGDRPSTLQVIGIVLALTGVALASREHQAGERRVAAGVGLALLAALGFGGYFVPMHAAGDADFLWASLIFRMTSFSIVALAALALRSSVRVSRGDAAFVAAVGLGDMIGNALFAASSAHGLVSVTSVLASLYPIVTVLLARIVLGERVDRGQEVGIVATLAGVALISAG